MPDYRAMAVQAAKQYGIPVQPFLRQLNQESGFRPGGITSSSGAKWIGQFIPSTAKAYGVHDDASSIYGAAHYMSDNLKRYGSMQRALSAYNSGRPDAYLDPNFAKGQTYNYVRSIMGGKDVHLEPSHTTTQPSVAQQSSPAENPHMWSNFALSLVQASKAHSPESMIGAIMQLRQSLNANAAQTQPVATPHGAQPGGPPGQGVTPGFTSGMKPFQEMLAAQALAKKMGMRYSENYDLPGGVHPVHVTHSYHYRKYGDDPKLGRATDVSGSPAQMAAYYRALAKTSPTELFYDPIGGIKYGKQIGAIGGHSDHVHIAY